MIYLDNNATTRIDDDVLETMLPYLRENYGNASSTQHKLGRTANQAIEKSRHTIANYLNANPKEIYFTSGATEAISTAIKGIFERYSSYGKHIITSHTEHKAVLSACEMLTKKGAQITYLSVDTNGNIDLDELRSAISKETILVCLMSANNETGVIHPIKEIASICESQDVLFFCDATQSIAKHEIDLSQIAIDILCFSAHKFHGPKGIGALYIRRKSKPIQIEPLIIGGKQENNFRGGTYNVPNIVGAGKAIEIINFEKQAQIAELRDYFEQQLTSAIDDCYVIAKQSKRISNTSNILFKHTRSSALMNNIPTVAISSGSACISGDRDPSHVLKAMQMSDDDALCCIRFSLSKYTTKAEVDAVIALLVAAVNKVRSASPIWQMYKAGLLDEL